MIGQRYVFSEGFFSAWVIIGFAWTWIAAITVIFLPVIEAREGISRVFRGIMNGGPVDDDKAAADTSKNFNEIVGATVHSVENKA